MSYKKTTVGVIIALLAVFLFAQCFNKAAKPAEKKPEIKLITHKEGADTLRRDTNAPLQALAFRAIKGRESFDICQQYDLSPLFQREYPCNGFYGEDHYRIEYIFTEVKRDSVNVNIYHVKGKNRHKKVISEFEGYFRILDLSEIKDPNIDITNYYGDPKIESHIYGATGDFSFVEKGDSPYSGTFSGTMKSEWSVRKNLDNNKMELEGLWYYSENLPSKSSGYLMEGNWTSKNGERKVPFIWAEDIFRFGNTILADFSYGEREVTINPKYRNLGWDEYLYSDEEWWNPTPAKPKM